MSPSSCRSSEEGISWWWLVVVAVAAASDTLTEDRASGAKGKWMERKGAAVGGAEGRRRASSSLSPPPTPPSSVYPSLSPTLQEEERSNGGLPLPSSANPNSVGDAEVADHCSAIVMTATVSPSR